MSFIDSKFKRDRTPIHKVGGVYKRKQLLPMKYQRPAVASATPRADLYDYINLSHIYTAIILLNHCVIFVENEEIKLINPTFGDFNLALDRYVQDEYACAQAAKHPFNMHVHWARSTPQRCLILIFRAVPTTLVSVIGTGH